MRIFFVLMISVFVLIGMKRIMREQKQKGIQQETAVMLLTTSHYSERTVTPSERARLSQKHVSSQSLGHITTAAVFADHFQFRSKRLDYVLIGCWE